MRLGGRTFLALILSHRNGNRYSLYLCWEAHKLQWYSCWVGNTRFTTSHSAVLDQLTVGRP